MERCRLAISAQTCSKVLVFSQANTSPKTHPTYNAWLVVSDLAFHVVFCTNGNVSCNSKQRNAMHDITSPHSISHILKQVLKDLEIATFSRLVVYISHPSTTQPSLPSAARTTQNHGTET
jgi:hypothetical protein